VIAIPALDLALDRLENGPCKLLRDSFANRAALDEVINRPNLPAALAS